MGSSDGRFLWLGREVSCSVRGLSDGTDKEASLSFPFSVLVFVKFGVRATTTG